MQARCRRGGGAGHLVDQLVHPRPPRLGVRWRIGGVVQVAHQHNAHGFVSLGLVELGRWRRRRRRRRRCGSAVKDRLLDREGHTRPQHLAWR